MTHRASHIRRPLQRGSLLALAVASAIGLAGCDDTDARFGDDRIAGSKASIVVANNGTDADGSSNVGTVDTYFDLLLENRFRLNTGANEGVAFDALGNLVQASGRSLEPGLRTACRLSSRGGAAFNTANLDLQITNGAGALSGPKGIAVAQAAGRIIAADTDNANLQVFSSTAAGDANPLATTPLSNAAWDIAYDESNDRLFAALTNGLIAVFDNYLLDPSAAADRTITPLDSDGQPVQGATNLHGIAFNGSSLVVSDVGIGASSTPGFDSDGSLYVFNDISAFTSGGDAQVQPSRIIRGPNSRLGNPVDINLIGNTLRVAEKANGGGAILFFADILSGGSGDVTPARAVATGNPESLAAYPLSLDLDDDVSDLDRNAALAGLAVTNNPGTGNTGRSVVLAPDSLSELRAFTTVEAAPNDTSTLENISYNQAGDAFLSADDGSAGSIIVVNRASVRADASITDSVNLDRRIAGANTGLIAPKGIDVVDQAGIVLVTDVGSARVSVFSLCAAGNASPLAFTNTQNLDGTPASAWDIDYDPDADRLFAAATNGTVLVYDRYLARLFQSGNRNGGLVPDRQIDPLPLGVDANNQPVSNLHGIIHDARRNRLILSDVGDAAVATDGRIYVLGNASGANGVVRVSREISGASTLLGNPVDLAFDGSNLYVAEKSNDLILRFDNIYSGASSDPNTAATLAASQTKPESVALLPASIPQSVQ